MTARKTGRKTYFNLPCFFFVMDSVTFDSSHHEKLKGYQKIRNLSIEWLNWSVRIRNFSTFVKLRTRTFTRNERERESVLNVKYLLCELKPSLITFSFPQKCFWQSKLFSVKAVLFHVNVNWDCVRIYCSDIVYNADELHPHRMCVLC